MVAIHSLTEARVNRWANDAPQVTDEVLRFLARHAPADHADAQAELAAGGRLRICVDVEGGEISRIRVRLLRADASRFVNKSLYTWRSSPDEADHEEE